jgi:hypothetical protein
VTPKRDDSAVGVVGLMARGAYGIGIAGVVEIPRGLREVVRGTQDACPCDRGGQQEQTGGEAASEGA